MAKLEKPRGEYDDYSYPAFEQGIVKPGVPDNLEDLCEMIRKEAEEINRRYDEDKETAVDEAN